MRVYAAIDDQSNRTLATPELLDQLGIQGKHAQFNMSSCSGNSTLTGRLANNICVQSIDGKSTFELQDVIGFTNTVGACTLPRHTSPIITHPSGSF
jgi:hypothetical protein